MNAQRLNLILMGLLIVGGAASYQFGNFGGVTYDELTQSYIAKNDLKFSDLPPKVQARYIDKELTVEQSKEGSLFEDELLDENGKPVLEEQATPRDFKRSIQKLQKMVLFLQHDNLITMNEKNELARKLEEQQSDQEEEKNKFQRKNIEKLNEVEQQHYRNISDLTAKLNELQKENVLVAQQGNVEIITLKQHIEDLKIQALEEAKKKEIDIKAARAEEQDKLVDYREKIRLLNDQLNLVNQQLAAQTDTMKSTVSRKNDEVSTLKNEITKLENEKNALIKSHNSTMESFKNENDKLLAQNRYELKLKEEALNQKLAQSDDKLKPLNTELSNAKKQIDALRLENEKDFSKFRTYLEDEKKLNHDLHVTIKKLEEENKLSQKSLQEASLKEQENLKNKEKKIQELEAMITSLKNQKIDIEAEIKRKIDENDKVHNKNYKIFNEKIATFEKSKQDLLQSIDKQLNEYKLASEENRRNADSRVEELNKTNRDLVLKNEASTKELSHLKNTLDKLSSEHQKAIDSERDKTKVAQEVSESLRKSIAQKEAETFAKIQALESELRAKEIAQAGNKREESLKIVALEKELKTKESDLLALKEANARKEETIASLHVKSKLKDDNTTSIGNKQIESLKEKLAAMEKARLADEAKQRSSNEEFKRKELGYLDQIKELTTTAKQAEKNLLAAKEGIEKQLFASEENGRVLQAKVKALENQSVKAVPLIADKASKSSSKKVQVLESVTCTDMSTGVNALSSRCKHDVETLLKKYDDTYFFEVTPIIDTGGFASLKSIKSKKVGIEDSEIDRISGLANIGLGKARAQTGGELIVQHIGANAKISYALSPLEQDRSRGFLIKVYQ